MKEHKKKKKKFCYTQKVSVEEHRKSLVRLKLRDVKRLNRIELKLTKKFCPLEIISVKELR